MTFFKRLEGVIGRRFTSQARATEDVSALLKLIPPKQRRPQTAVVLDESGERYRSLLNNLSQRARLIVFVGEGVTLDLGAVRATPFADRAELHSLLLDRPPLDLFLDLRNATAAEQLTMWKMAYFHVYDRGAYVHTRTPTAVSGWTESVSLKARRQDAKGAVFEDLAASTRWVRVLELRCGEVVAYKKSRRHLYLMHDKDAATLVAHRVRGLELDLLGSIPATTIESGATVRQHGVTTELRGFGDTFRVPDLHAWHYRGRIALDSHMLAYRGASVLPPSFRFPAQPRLLNPRLKRATDEWARLTASVKAPAVTLEGDYFDANPGYPSMFGHVMTQSVHKLWAWDEAKRQLPDLKALIYVREGREPTVERGLLNAYGIADDDICFISEAVYVDSYVSPTIMWEYIVPWYVSPLALDVWRRIGRGLGVTKIEPRDKLFISRRETASVHRVCRNTDEVEAVFSKHGFTVVYPEDYSLNEQAAIFASAEVLAGFGGSAMFNMMYGSPKNVIVLNHEGYSVRNEHLYTALLGSTVDYFWSAADIPHPDGGWAKEAFKSSWEFDFERNGSELTSLLESLS